jgi:hypothetical protein
MILRLLSAIMVFAAVAMAGDFRIPKEQFYERVHTVVVSPVENVVWEQMNELYRMHDLRFSMMLEWGAIRISDYAQLSDSSFVNAIKAMAETTAEAALRGTGRFEVISPSRSADSIAVLMDRLNVHNTRNPMWGNYEHPNKDTLQERFLTAIPADAVLFSGFYLCWYDKGFYVRYGAHMIDPVRRDTLWLGSVDLDPLMHTNAKNVFYEGDIRDAVKRTLKSIKKK